MRARHILPGLVPYAVALGMFSFFVAFSSLRTAEGPPTSADEDEYFCFQGACPDEDAVAVAPSSSGENATPTPAPAGDWPPAFVDVTQESGADFVHHNRTELLEYGGGIAVLDFNGDGYDDLYVVDSSGPNALYKNKQDGTFIDVAAEVGVSDSQGYGNGSCAADYDNDGDTDLYVTNYGPSRLFRNEGGESFLDVTQAAGADDSRDSDRNTGCAWGDYDQDGFLDLVVLRHYHEGTSNIFRLRLWFRAVRRLRLLHNDGDGTFTDVAHLLGDVSEPEMGNPPFDYAEERSPDEDRGQDEEPGPLTGEFVGNVWGAGFQPAWLDFDNDGDLDLYVVNDTGWEIQPNVLWRNDGPAPDGLWRFVDVSEPSGADLDIEGMGLAVGDYDLDGDMDLFVTNIGDNVLLSNSGDGHSFVEVTQEAGVAVGKVGRNPRITWSALSLDYDNDGDEDLYLVSGWIKGTHRVDRDTTQPNVLLRNRGGRDLR